MGISSEKVKEYYKRYETAKNIWSNINSENININSKLMYNLYKNLSEYPILNSTSSYEEKKLEVLDRFADLGAFMFDTESINILVARNNESYAFLNIPDNPFHMTEGECEQIYKIDNKESLLETKVRTIDCESKILEMCMVQILKLVEPDVKNKVKSGENAKEQIIGRVQEYIMLIDKLQGLKLREHPELQKASELFTSAGYFDMSKFLEKVNETNVKENNGELSAKYKQIIDTAVNSDKPNQQRRSLKGMKYDVNNLGKFAIAKRLMTKLYEYKEIDLYDVFNEYDIIKGTKEEENVLITSNSDAKMQNKNIKRVVNITIAGYNQPFCVSIREDAYRQYEKKFGVIPSNVLNPVTRGSNITFKPKEPIKSIVSKVYKQDRSPKTIQYLIWLEESQDIKYCREEILKQQNEKNQNKEYVNSNDNADRIKSVTSKMGQIKKKSEILEKLRESKKRLVKLYYDLEQNGRNGKDEQDRTKDD